MTRVKDPGPPELDPEPPPRVFGPAVWISLLFGLVCVALGAAVAAYGPRLFPPAMPARAARPWQPPPPPVEGRLHAPPRSAAGPP